LTNALAVSTSRSLSTLTPLAAFRSRAAERRSAKG
jgi:hypothetical protein